jgi:hypothetical protein
MNKSKMIFWLAQILIVLILVVISGCEKSSSNDFKDFLGTWVSTDLSDTLDFRTEHDLYSNRDYYVYSLSRDSITIRYDGKMFIYVSPTTHFYQLNGNKLTIDFRPFCYGFNNQITEFSRK